MHHELSCFLGGSRSGQVKLLSNSKCLEDFCGVPWVNWHSYMLGLLAMYLTIQLVRRVRRLMGQGYSVYGTSTGDLRICVVVMMAVLGCHSQASDGGPQKLLDTPAHALTGSYRFQRWKPHLEGKKIREHKPRSPGRPPCFLTCLYLDFSRKHEFFTVAFMCTTAKARYFPGVEHPFMRAQTLIPQG